MRKRTLTLTLIALFVILTTIGLAACAASGGIQGPHAVKNGEESDWVSAVEERANGSFVIWPRYDNNSNYCTYDSGMIASARSLMEKGLRVIFTYNTISVGATDAAFLGGGCDSENTSLGQTYRLESIKAADGQ